ncbi:MAG TPA: AAA family ATPase [Candidatus Saccharimonadales bacterium]
MSLVYITGISGSGKSSVMKELEKHGFEAHGVDEEGFADWIDRDTGMAVPFPHYDINVNVHDWYRKHRWVLSEKRIGELKEYADKANRVVFLAGTADGEDKVWHFFNKVITLSVDEATMRQRLEQRPDNHFGKTAEEMADILKWLKDHNDNYQNFGAFVVDATRPLNQVVDDVINLAE